MIEQTSQRLIKDLQIALEETTIFTVPPHYERWEDGFNSLDKAREKISALKVELEHTGSSPVWIFGDLAQVHGRLNDFVRLRDSFYQEFPSGGDSHNWHGKSVAERELDELQRDVARLKINIRTHLSNVPETEKRQKIQQWFASLFGVIFIVGLIVLAVIFPTPTQFQYTVFRIVLALAVAGVAAMIPGFLQVTISNWIRAGGALAVFVLVFFYNPAALVQDVGHPTDPLVRQKEPPEESKLRSVTPSSTPSGSITKNEYDSIPENVKAIFAGELKRKPSDIALDSTMKNLGLEDDPTAMAEILMSVQERYRITFANDEMYKLETVQAWITFVRLHVHVQSGDSF